MRAAVNILSVLVSLLILHLFLYNRAVIADISLKSSSLSRLVISYRPLLSPIDTLRVNDTSYTLFQYDNHTTINPPGAPSLPVKTVYFAAPQDVVPVVETENLSQSIVPGIVLLPVPRLTKDESGFTVEVHEEDPAFYALSGYRPRRFAELGNNTNLASITIWRLILTPVLYDARASTAAIADSFDVNISFGSSKITPHMLPKRIPEYVINHELFEKMAVEKPISTVTNPFTTGDWYRIKLSQNGIYRITGEELGQAGFPTDTVHSDEIRMYYGGGRLLSNVPYEITTDDFQETSIKINDNGDGIFNINDSIDFYGEALSRFILKADTTRPEFQNHLYSDDNYYWLTFSNEGVPKRMESTGETPQDNIEAHTTYRYLKHIEHENIIENVEDGHPTGIEWYWDAISTQTRSYSFNAPGIVYGTKANVRIAFIQQMNKVEHNIDIYINTSHFSSHVFPNVEKGFIDIIYETTLQSKNNVLNINRKHDGTKKSIHLDWIDVEYERELALESNKLEFFWTGDGTPTLFTIPKVFRSSIKVFDTTDPYNVRENNFSVYDNVKNTLKFQTTVPNGKVSRFTLCDPRSYLQVSSIAKKSRSNLRNPAVKANYFIITHEMFLDEANELAEWRSRDSHLDPLTPMVVNVADIYDEFNWGVLDPMSIRDFLKFSWENNAQRKRFYCCIFGDTIYKYKNLTENQAGKNFVPTYMGMDANGPVTSDDYYGCFNIIGLPSFSFGRLCATDKESAQILVDKIIEYERNPEQGLWHNRVLLIADDETGEGGFGNELVHSTDIESLDNPAYIPSSMERMKIMLIEYPLKNFRKPEVTEDLLSAFHDGYITASFIGHGNNNLLAHEHILVGARDIERFNNASRQPLFTVFSCTVGNFAQLDNISLAEMLHLRKGGGCIGVIAATSRTYSLKNIALNKSLFINLFDRKINPDHRIGYGLLKAKLDVIDENSNRYILLGDPATRLMIPGYGFTVASVDTIYRLQKLDLSGCINDGNNPLSYNGTLHIRALGTKKHKKYKTQSYTQPGKTFYFGEIPISENHFDAALVIPKDIPSGGKESSIHFFATGQEVEAAGSIDEIYIGGLYEQAPDDRNGPEIQLAFDGKNFDDGDYISRQPSLQATISDPSGINVYGNRGHNITILTDKTDIVILTNRFKSVKGYTTGMFEYSLPILSPGEHSFEITVYDTYNNVTKKRVSSYVVGSETGDISILNLLNYPNPMDSEGTTFAFSLTDEARYAEIKIYSQSGRLVDTLKFNAEYGFNMVKWKPLYTIANGVYFFKLTVKSLNGRKSSKIEKLVVMR